MLTHHSGPDAAEVERAKDMCIELLNTVKTAYDQFKERGPRGGGGYYGGDRGGYNGGEDRGGYHQRERHPSGSYGGGSQYGGSSQYGGGYNPQQPAGYGGAQSPAAAQASAGQPQAAANPAEQQAQYQAWAAYYAANPAQDPYATYGGYGAVMAAYMQNPGYYQQQQGQPMAGSPTAGQNGYGAPPPPPPEDSSVPPPPPGASGGGYSAVPPPPGM